MIDGGKPAATARSWDHQPFGEVRPIPYAARFSEAETARIQDGHIPRDMDDKWFIYFDAPSLCLHRSWTGEGVYRVDLAPNGSGSNVVAAFGAGPQLAGDDAAYDARVLSFLIDNLLLDRGVPFPVPEGMKEPAEGVFQHVVAGTGYPQVVHWRRRWWRFWRR